MACESQSIQFYNCSTLYCESPQTCKIIERRSRYHFQWQIKPNVNHFITEKLPLIEEHSESNTLVVLMVICRRQSHRRMPHHNKMENFEYTQPYVLVTFVC